VITFFFHAFKQKFRRIQPKTTVEDVSSAAHTAYREISEQTVRSCWRKCGLLLVPDPRITLQNQYTIDFVDSDNESEKAELMGDQVDADSSGDSDSDSDYNIDERYSSRMIQSSHLPLITEDSDESDSDSEEEDE